LIFPSVLVARRSRPPVVLAFLLLGRSWLLLHVWPGASAAPAPGAAAVLGVLGIAAIRRRR